jgi:hypothetical protein
LRTFCDKHRLSSEPTPVHISGSDAHADRALASKVRSWLGRYADVDLGADGSYNNTSWARIEAELPECLGRDPENNLDSKSKASSVSEPRLSKESSCRTPRIYAKASQPRTTALVLPVADFMKRAKRVASLSGVSGKMSFAAGSSHNLDDRAPEVSTLGRENHDWILQNSSTRKGFGSSSTGEQADAAEGEEIEDEAQYGGPEQGDEPPTPDPSRRRRSQRAKPIAATPRSKLKRRRPQNDDEEVIRGRPRKYQRGTEKFWRWQFKKAREDAAGTMDQDELDQPFLKDSLTRAIYSSRPASFDRTLVAALNAKLPVPMTTDDINEEWVYDTRNVLNRPSTGVYMSPLGIRGDYFRRLSRVMIVKNPRLRSLDLNDRDQVYPFRFITSSASHSFAYRPFYPALSGKIIRKAIPARRPTNPPLTGSAEKQSKGPRKGLFYEDVGAAHRIPPNSTEPVAYELPADVLDQSTDEDKAQPSHANEADAQRSPGSVSQVRRNVSTQPSAVSRQQAPRQLSLAKKGATSYKSPEIKASKAQNTRSRPSRARKLTEKAAQMLEMQDQIQRSLHSRSATPRSSPVEDSVAVVDSTPATDANFSSFDPVVPNLDAGAASQDRSHGTDSESARIEGNNDVIQSAIEDTATSGSDMPLQPSTEQVQSKTRQLATGDHALRRQMILDLVKETGGVVPYDLTMLRDVRACRWKELGGTWKLYPSAVEMAVKALCKSGQLKQAFFTFRGASGHMVKRSMLVLPSVLPNSKEMDETKQNIMAADPESYIPPTWIDEIARGRLAVMSWGEERSAKQRSATSPASMTSGKRRRATSVASNDTRVSTRSGSLLNATERIHAPVPVTAASGFVTLEIPSLHSLPVVQLAKWRRECPVASLVHDASYKNPWRPIGIRPKIRRRKAQHLSYGSTIIWENFPSSLDDVLKLPGLNVHFNYGEFVSEDADWQRFACEVEGVRVWEEQNVDTAQSERSRYAFINHTVPDALYHGIDFPLRVEFATQTHFDRNGIEIESVWPLAKPWAVFADALQTSPETASRITQPNEQLKRAVPPPRFPPDESSAIGLRRTKRATKPKLMPDNVFFDPVLELALESVPAPAPSTDSDAEYETGAAQAEDVEEEPGPESESEVELEEEEKDPEAGTRPRRRKSSTKPRGSTVFKKRKNRRPPKSKTEQLTGSEQAQKNRTRRLVVSTVLVRTFLGGSEGLIDWSIVNQMMPTNREVYLRARWEFLSREFADEVDAVTAEFERHYLNALEAGEAPEVDVDHPERTNWAGLLEWTLEMVELEGRFEQQEEPMFELPQTRAELLDSYGFNDLRPRRHRDKIPHLPISAREASVIHALFGTACPIDEYHGLQTDSRVLYSLGANDLRLAASWVLAIVLTPTPTFDKQLGEQKLAQLAPTAEEREQLLRGAIGHLEDSKLIQKFSSKQRGDAESDMRLWGPHPSFLARFEGLDVASPETLRCALGYKLSIVDAAFQNGDSVELGKDAVTPNAEMLALLNLMSMGQVQVRPGPDVPRSRYGIDHERVGYEIRSMDKDQFCFSVAVGPTGRYEFGDPTAQARKMPCPRGETDQVRGLIPPWIDIHGNVNHALWEAFLAGALGLVFQHPGISAREVSEAFGVGLVSRDVKTMLDWAVDGGFARSHPETGGYFTTEYWWMCMGPTHARVTNEQPDE